MSKKTLYQHQFEHDSCGFGLIANLNNNPSHWLVQTSIQALNNLSHRGSVAADGLTADGCGLLLKKPDAFLRKCAKEKNITLNKNYAVGTVFLNTDKKRAALAEDTLSKELSKQGLACLWFRDVPIDSNFLGERALNGLPCIKQVFVNAPGSISTDEFNRALFMARVLTHHALKDNDKTFYITSLSPHVIAYKALVTPANLAHFFKDLNDPDLITDLCVFHQRYSTNTLPQWHLAQPFRFLAHNGEINTIRGNRNWANARANKFASDLLPKLSSLFPIVSHDDSDSCSLDNMLELLIMGGVDIFHALKILMPPAWQNIEQMDPDLRAFYEYYSMHMEPWGGPAGLVLTDGRYGVCNLDRNGLRPARWVLTDDHHFTLASEIGVYDYEPHQVVAKGRVAPGEMLAVDTQSGEILFPDTINDRLKKRRPYKEWLRNNKITLRTRFTDVTGIENPMLEKELMRYQKMFGLTFDEQEQVLKTLAVTGSEMVGSMGDDTPLAVLSAHARPLYDYFRQMFAQVTNPPIDSLREKIAMSLQTRYGKEKNIFCETEALAKRMLTKSPVLSESKRDDLLNLDPREYPHRIFNLNYPATTPLKEAIIDLTEQALKAAKDGVVLLVLTDKGITPGKLPVHPSLATGAIHHRLIQTGYRCDVNIIVETATVRDPHQFAVLIGFGATAIYPYLAYETVDALCRQGVIKKTKDYRKGIETGLYKILSKMGISTISSYRGAQLFEIVGLHHEVVDLCFAGTTSRIEGATFDALQKEQEKRAAQCWNNAELIDKGGRYKYVHGGEYHAFNPSVVHALQSAVNIGDYSLYKTYADLVNQRPTTGFRDLFQLKKASAPLSLDQVDSSKKIFSTFVAGAMSLGALSPEAHEALAMALNDLGGKSNSGEGGEDPARFTTNKTSKIKQVASGRFGVTPHYLVNAEMIQIKIAQGAKPGEGGQLLGHKVNHMIAKLRFSSPGVALISPPPHHDIYSIEDLAQLIYDLKQVNPTALISVKLVSEAGVGTIAVGVAKAYADHITISGNDGGTGASPLTSIHNAGSPWELGLAEAHYCLQANDLREKVLLEVDGGLKTGLDVIKAAILGAELFAFGTAPLVALGCTYLRICHLNTCATGVATQNETLRKQFFSGTVDKAKNYFKFVAHEVREWLAYLGVSDLRELIGRTDLLTLLPGQGDKQTGLDLTPILTTASALSDQPRYCNTDYNSPADKGVLACKILKDTLPAIQENTGGHYTYAVRNIDRSIGAKISGEIARQHGAEGLSIPLHIHLTGSAGQSLGAWNAVGLHLSLEGDANDYVGKGMAGGEIIIYPPSNSRFTSNETSIIGNTCLYGATGGKLFASGLAGERFAVRNSGATAVVEGVGDHCCEYMTGGVAVVLGKTGINFGAGMTGGVAFVLDTDHSFVDSYNHELIDIHRIQTDSMEEHQNYLLNLLTEYTQKTGSLWGKNIIDHFYDRLPEFWMVKPIALDFESIADKLLSPS